MRNAWIGAVAVAFSLSNAAGAAVITFNASDNGQQALPSTYQPLLDGYAGDGGALGVTIDWGGTWSSRRDVNGGVTDHSPNGLGYVAYDNGASTNKITFDKAVTLPSFFFANFFGGTNFTVNFKGFTNANDATPVVDITRTYNQTTGPNNGGYQWIEETGFGSTPIRAFSFTGQQFKQLDDMTVSLAVPEPATWGLMIGGFGLAGAALRRRRSVPA